MKKLLITLLAAVFASGAFAQAPFPDIPDNHWAGDAVADIAELGIVIGFPDGTFRGNEAFTRYQAALVVARMLDVIADDMDARFALSDEDMASLRNALQELASDVAAQGVRLSDVEGNVASLSDDVMTNQSRLDEIESMLEGVGDDEVVRDLLNQLASQRVALDTAQAQAESAEALANNALSAANAAAARARANEEAIGALNSVIQGIGDRVTALEQAGRGGEGIPVDLLDRVAANEADIANIREFVILLRRDQVALRDRVSALEESDAAQNEQLAALDERVTALEENPLGLSGSISVDYEANRLIGQAFDVDRAYGLNADRDMGASVFSTGAKELDGDSSSHRNYKTEVGEVAQDIEDMDGIDEPLNASLDLEADFGNLFDAAGSPNALNQFSAAVSINLVQVGTPLVDTDGDAINMPFVFSVDEFTITFDPIGADPINFIYGEELEVQLTPYVFELDEEPGFMVTAGGPDFLAFLDPQLTFAYSGQDTDDDTEVDYVKYGVRLAVSPIEGVTIGASYAAAAENSTDKDDYLGDNVNTNLFGVDGSVSISIFDLGFEYANSTITDVAADTSDSENLIYVTLDVDAADLPILDELSANYRSIPNNWDAYGLTDDADDPFEPDQTGFAVNAGLELFILDVDAFFDSYSITDPGEHDVTAFGVEVGADLFAGFSISGFFEQVAVDGTTVDATNSPFDEGENRVLATGNVERDTRYETGFGVDLAHDGDAENALISGLNLGFGYAQMEADFSVTELYAEADMDFDVAFLSLTPYVAWEMSNDSDTDVTAESSNEIRAGTGLTTDPFDIFFAPSLEAAVNFRTTSYYDFGNNDPDFTASELQWSVGLAFNEFLFDNSVLTAKYGSWTGTNVNTERNTRGTGDGATDISGDDVNPLGDDVTQWVSGYELIWNYFDLELAYGVYTSSAPGAGESSGQAFSIAYTVDF